MNILGQAMRAMSVLFMVLGLFFSLVTAIGMLRFPDAYTRLHAGAKGLVIGMGCLFIGSVLSAPSPSHAVKTVLIGLFLAVTNPIAIHALARANYRLQKRRLRLVIDEYQEWKGP